MLRAGCDGFGRPPRLSANPFGPAVRALVEEVTDDKSLEKDERKRLQVAHAPRLSPRAKLIKLADKICNVRDVMYAPPKTWDQNRRVEYLKWARQVVDGCRGTNPALEGHFDALLGEAEGLRKSIES